MTTKTPKKNNEKIFIKVKVPMEFSIEKPNLTYAQMGKIIGGMNRSYLYKVFNRKITISVKVYNKIKSKLKL